MSTLRLNASFGKMIYDVNEITNVNGGITLRDRSGHTSKFVHECIRWISCHEWKLLRTGFISKPRMDFNFDIKDMDINKAANQFNTIDKMAPIAKACNGRFSTKMNMKK
jgi:hypothetical protein